MFDINNTFVAMVWPSFDIDFTITFGVYDSDQSEIENCIYR